MARNTDRLLRLVDELLLVDRLESGAAEMAAAKVDVADVVRQVVSSSIDGSGTVAVVTLRGLTGDGGPVMGADR